MDFFEFMLEIKVFLCARKLWDIGRPRAEAHRDHWVCMSPETPWSTVRSGWRHYSVKQVISLHCRSQVNVPKPCTLDSCGSSLSPPNLASMQNKSATVSPDPNEDTQPHAGWLDLALPCLHPTVGQSNLYFILRTGLQRLLPLIHFKPQCMQVISVPSFDVVPSNTKMAVARGLTLTWIHPEEKLLSKPQVEKVWNLPSLLCLSDLSLPYARGTHSTGLSCCC